MARFNTMLAVLAATGLTLAQPAAAAARTAAATGESEALTDAPGAGPVIGVLGLLGLVFLVMVISDGDDNDDPPASP